MVPDPELRFGLRQITTSQWFKNSYKPSEPIGEGTKIGFDDVKVYNAVLENLSHDQVNKIDVSHVKKCLEANNHNALTAYYYLLLKHKVICGEPLELDSLNITKGLDSILMPKDRRTKKF